MSIGRSLITSFLAIAAVAAASGCGLPTLEPESCTAARSAVREFYSFHFGNEMGHSSAALEARRRFLTSSMASEVARSPEGSDPFTTGSEDRPKAFRVGECTVLDENNADLKVLLFWRDENASRQRPITVSAANIDGQWLVNKVDVTNNDK